MRRLELQEIHDHPAFPAPLRNLVTDALQSLWEFGNSYKPVLPRLLDGMERAGTREVLDLCSGGGGPWLRLAREPELRRAAGIAFGIAVRLSDKYPNLGAFERASAVSDLLRFEPAPVDATDIPAACPASGRSSRPSTTSAPARRAVCSATRWRSAEASASSRWPAVPRAPC